MATYSIKGRHETEGQWWNNEFGWTDHPQRDIFSETERHALNLPLGGEWMTEPTVDPEGEFANEFPDEHSHDPQIVDEGVYGLHVTDDEGRHYYLQIAVVDEGLVIDVFDRYGEQDLATFAKTYDELFEFVMSNDPLS